MVLVSSRILSLNSTKLVFLSCFCINTFITLHTVHYALLWCHSSCSFVCIIKEARFIGLWCVINVWKPVHYWFINQAIDFSKNLVSLRVESSLGVNCNLLCRIFVLTSFNWRMKHENKFSSFNAKKILHMEYQCIFQLSKMYCILFVTIVFSVKLKTVSYNK